MDNSDTNSKSSNLLKKKKKLRTYFSLSRNCQSKNKNTSSSATSAKQNLNRSSSSSEIEKSSDNPSKSHVTNHQQKDSIFGTFKRNFQNKFSPNRKVVASDSGNSIPISTTLQCDNELEVESSCSNPQQRMLMTADVPSNTSRVVPVKDVCTTHQINQAVSISRGYQEREMNLVCSLYGQRHPVIILDPIDQAKSELSKYSWYWGSLSRTAAQKNLAGKPNGSFLVRDSETDQQQFTLSFRSAGVTLHSRISYVSGSWQIESFRYESIVDLFEESMRKSKEDIFSYVRTSNCLMPPIPVCLINPINRYFEVASLQHLCRLVIRSKIDLDKLAAVTTLPTKVKLYIENCYENV